MAEALGQLLNTPASWFEVSVHYSVPEVHVITYNKGTLTVAVVIAAGGLRPRTLKKYSKQLP